MKIIRFFVVTVLLCVLLMPVLSVNAAVAGENITNDGELDNFAELEYTVLANTVTIFGQAPRAEETEITVWIKEDGTGNNLVIRQFKSNEDGSFERKFMLSTALYDAENTATMMVGAENTNTQMITEIPLYSQAETDGCVEAFGSISNKESIGAFLETYSYSLNLNDEEGNPPQYSDEELDVLFEIYEYGNYEATDTEGVFAAINDILNKFTRRSTLLDELNAAADGGAGDEVKNLLMSKYASILTFEITTSRVIKEDEMWLRMTESTLTDSRGDVLGSEKDYRTMDDIKAAYEAAYAAQYDCDIETGGVLTTDRTYNFVELDENGNSVWKLSYFANIVTITGKHELAMRTNIAVNVTDATTDSIQVAMQQVKSDAEGNFTVTMPFNTERFGEETLAIIRIGALETNAWQFFVPVFPQTVIDTMVEEFKIIGDVDDLRCFIEDNEMMAEMAGEFSQQKLDVMYELYTEKKYSEFDNTVDVVYEILALVDGANAVLNFLDALNETTNEEDWEKVKNVIESDYRDLANISKHYADLITYAEKAENLKEPEGLYRRLIGQNFYTVQKVIDAYAIALSEQQREENNRIMFIGKDEVEFGEEEIVQTVSISTYEKIAYFTVTVKFPQTLELAGVKENGFIEIYEDSRVEEDGYVLASYTCLYDYEGNTVPTGETIYAFDMIFNTTVATKEGIIKLEFVDGLMHGDKSYGFSRVINKTITILPKLAEAIEILGADKSDGRTKYTAKVLPDYTSNKEVEWSVDNNEIAKISADGILTPLKNGIVTIMAIAKDGSGVFATKTVEVVAYAKLNSLISDIGTWNVEFDPENRDYTIYVKEDVSAINITPRFSGGGVIRPNGSGIWINGAAKNFGLTDENTVIIINIQNVTGMTNGEYRIKVVKLEETEVNVNNEKRVFEIVTVGADRGSIVILALYKGNRFAGMEKAIYEGQKIELKAGVDFDKAKVMIWTDFTGFVPQIDSITIE